MDDMVVLVDENDNETGAMEKLKAHIEGKLHRAFSVFISNSSKQLLIQKRAIDKYHSGGLWTNTCCSHPRPGEYLKDAVERRIQEEMGFRCLTKEIFSTIYTSELDNNIIENEYDHIFIGQYNGYLNPDPREVEDWKWMSIEDLQTSLKQNPQKYTYWFKLLLEDVVSYL